MKIQTKLRRKKYIFETKAGLFSKDKVDKGSALLIENMTIQNGDKVIDLGCGYGAIGIVAARLTPSGFVYLVDTDIRAVKYSQINVKLNKVNNVAIVASDGFEKIPRDLIFNIVVSNPPSHMPKETIIEFIQGAKEHLVDNGKLYFVTERRIKPLIKRLFTKYFENYKTLTSKAQYVVSIAYKRKD